MKKDFSHLLQRTRYSRTLKCERLTDRVIRFWYGNVTWVVKCDLIRLSPALCFTFQSETTQNWESEPFT